MNTRFCPSCRRNFGNLDRCPVDGSPLIALPQDYPAPSTTVHEDYELLTPMAAGGMSRIYRGRSRVSSSPVAVKILDPRLAAHPYTIDRFYREARVSQMLDHTNVVHVEDFGPTKEGHHAIVMELLGGESLGSAIRRLRRMPWQRAVHIAIELCDALGHAHSRRVVHRDVKPENIQLLGHVGPDERVKLLDFGVAYVAADKHFRTPAPGSTNVSGTPAYMSPEQIRGNPLDGRSDLYAVGILLFEMISGQRPFLGDDPVEVCRKQLYDKPPLLSRVLPADVQVPAEIQLLIKELLQKSPRSRVPGVGAVLGRLLQLLPQDRWPTRLRRMKATNRASAMWAHSAKAPHHPTAELLFRAPTTMVTVVQLEIRSDERSHHGAAAWSEDVDFLLAGWRALVEERGGLVQQPEPDTMRAVFGLFKPLQRAEDVFDCVEHVRHLKDLFEAYGHRDGGSAPSLKAAALRVRMEDPVAGGDGMPVRDSRLARELCRRAPMGGLVVTDEIKEALADYCHFEPLTFLNLDGEEPVPIYRLGGSKPRPKPLLS